MTRHVISRYVFRKDYQYGWSWRGQQWVTSAAEIGTLFTLPAGAVHDATGPTTVALIAGAIMTLGYGTFVLGASEAAWGWQARPYRVLFVFPRLPSERVMPRSQWAAGVTKLRRVVSCRSSSTFSARRAPRTRSSRRSASPWRTSRRSAGASCSACARRARRRTLASDPCAVVPRRGQREDPSLRSRERGGASPRSRRGPILTVDAPHTLSALRCAAVPRSGRATGPSSL